MDEEEIDAWYDEEKEKLTEKCKLEFSKLEGTLEDSKDFDPDDFTKYKVKYKERDEKAYRKDVDAREKLKKKFLRSLDRLHENYELMSGKRIESSLRGFFFRYRLNLFLAKLLKPINDLKEKMKADKKAE
jgi:hypothetical protein